jgi:hypothetical protein|tara:strand:+ start:2798 stop:3346 length:549 start_codon:yes stop_codon:yes gene_type:complete
MDLKDTWSLYLHYKNLGKLYNDNIEKLIDIPDIKTFWETYNNIPTISEIFSDGIRVKKIKRTGATPCAYSFFKRNIFPCWEDPMNNNGFELSIRNNYNFNMFQEQWLNSLLQLISGNEKLDCINGIRIVDCTKGKSVLYRMEFWVSDEKFKTEVEDILKSELFSLNKYIIMYRSHVNIKEAV